MTNWINETFNVDNNVSLPIIISLIVFITGGIVRYIFVEINNFKNRNRLRETFKMLNRQMIKDLGKKEKVAYKFYPTISPKNREHWKLKHIPLNYLETYFELDYQELYFSFQKKLFWIKKRKIKEEAFHKIWSELRNVQYFEKQKENDIENLISNFKEAHSDYNEKLIELKKFHDDLTTKVRKDPLFINEMHLQTVKKYYFNIWKRFLEIEERKRQHHFSSYKILIQPIIQLAKEYPDHPIMEALIPLVVNCEIKYNRLENVLNLYQEAFKNHYFVYRTSRRFISKANKII